MEGWRLNQRVDGCMAILDAETSRFWRFVFRVYKRRLERILDQHERKATQDGHGHANTR